MSTDLKDRIKMKKLEIAEIEAQTKLEQAKTQRAQLPGKILWLTAEEWIEIGHTAGGCIWSIPVIVLFIIIILDPQKIEAYDQFLVSFGGAAFAFYLAKNIRK